MQVWVQDPYQVLGVSQSANEAQIREAFRRLACEHHPDRNPDDPGAKERFQEINSAYQILSDAERRAHYDRFGKAPPAGARASSQGAPWGAAGPSLEDLLSELFGGGGGVPTRPRGDLRQVLKLSFEEAALGTTSTLEFQRLDVCGVCKGRGGEPGTGYERCGACAGQGRVQDFTSLFSGNTRGRPCRHCQGKGELPKSKCRHCDGRGVAAKQVRLEVKIPPGIEHGATQHVTGAGNRPSPDAPAGDLEIVIAVKEHKRYKREGDDVLTEETVPFTTAVLGGKLIVKTLHGDVEVKVPAGTAHGDEILLKGKGVPHRFRSGAGAHRVRVRLRIPDAPSPKAQELISELDAELSNPSAGNWANPLNWFK